MSKVIRFLPLILFVLLAILLFRGLSLDPTAMPSALEGKAFPEFQLTELQDENKTLSKDDFADGIKLVNVWATWCPGCKYEHPFLLKIARDKRFALYGVNYKDARDDALQWLEQYNNPFQFTMFDVDGKLGMDLGVYGAPETFVVDHNNRIRKRFAGILDEAVWQQQFEPLLLQLQQEVQDSSNNTRG
ncbi:DsbE family thiol:disulfide interchange protein [Thalassotalea mangrovi]|uniref:DsbE family thiol:disulfide interchange protein n=1 Tax=Thalassotalea mangrovi TaxID=2572245 RepID=A0A4U1BAH7_9GAMM|nr:DsbE family thiol:disulfide interchange protein [Thalassotalea mangrovi]TKB47533.1 DsbE family thiol:disulfide interchange protein [Thalassotalea mangrovi]